MTDVSRAREALVTQLDAWAVRDGFPDLAALVPLLFSESEMDVLSEHPEHGPLIRAARALS